MAERMGLGAVLVKLTESETGRRAIRHLWAASQAKVHNERRHHLRAAVRLARKSLTR